MLFSKKILFTFLIIFSNLLFSQESYIVIDSLSNEPISYANIWINNKIFTNSDENGIFIIENKNATYNISCLGYKKKKIDLSKKKVLLSPESINLKEIIVTKKKSNKEIKIGSNKNKDINIAANYNNRFAEIGKIFFPQDTSCLFLKEVKFNTFSMLNNATVKINIYSLDNNMHPLELINNNILICNIKKGNQKSKINLEGENIIVPKEGFMVSIQILLIEENKSYREYNKKLYQYEPSLFVKKNSPNDFTYNLSQYNNWQKISNSDLNIEITLTN
jgi:hypothetical protein